MNTKALQGIIRIATAIGRWVVEHIAARGIELLLGYMDGKIMDFKRRRDRPLVAKWRVKFLNGRIARWTAAVKWLRANSRSLTQKAAAEAVKASEKLAALPIVAPGEREKSKKAA